MISNYLIAGVAGVVVCGGILTTRLLHQRRRSLQIVSRMKELAGGFAASQPANLVSNPTRHRLELKFPVPGQLLFFWERLLYQNDMSGRLADLSLITLILIAGAAVAGLELGAPSLLCLILAIGIGSLPTALLLFRRAKLNERFVEQLPSAIDLMVSVLKSGHSIPQSVQSVADEIPAPCGTEFSDVLQRIYLGQTLSAALSISAQRFESFDLDLIKRAVAIQAEVGGSLAELLDKTNSTIRHRLRLAKQARALTAQSRLTAIIVGVMPFFLAAFLQSVNPGYLNPLITTDLGKMLLAAAAVLQVIGIIIMNRLSTVKV